MTLPAAKKKILYLITKGNWGGAQRYVYDLATNLPRSEFETVIACGSNGIFTEKLRTAGIRTVFLSSLQRDISFGKELKALGELVRLFKKERPDIIHLNSSKAAGLGVLAARLCILFSRLRIKDKGLRIPKIIFTVHGWPFKEARSLPVRIGIWFASYITALAATDVIVLSREDFRLGTRMPGISGKLSLIYHGIEHANTLPREKARQLLGEGNKSGTFWIGTIAELTPNKGLTHLIEAAARLPHKVILCLIGGGEEQNRLEALAKNLGMRSRVIFAGFRENTAELLSAFDLFALPSLKEGLPYALLEAGLYGLPVVASDISGIRDIIPEPTLGIRTAPGDSGALARALAELIDDPARRSMLGTAVKEYVARTFSPADMLARTQALYTERITPP